MLMLVYNYHDIACGVQASLIKIQQVENKTQFSIAMH